MSHAVQNLWSGLWSRRFTDHEPRLRFELGGRHFDTTQHTVPRFLQALNRASTVADALFPEACVAIVACHRQPSETEHGPPLQSGFDVLHDTGFTIPQTTAWQAVLYPGPYEPAPYSWDLRSYGISGLKSARDTLLWHAIADEMPVFPSAAIVTFLLDPGTSTMLHVYDDRGMDVMAKDPQALRHLHKTFDSWLLDYDRERMSRLF